MSFVICHISRSRTGRWWEALEKRFKVTCFVGHDIRLGAGRALLWCESDCEDSILVRVYRGTGRALSPTDVSLLAVTAMWARLVISSGTASERCHCGNFGCLETVAANAVIEHRVRHLCWNKVTRAA